jgi:hypothetical protein
MHIHAFLGGEGFGIEGEEGLMKFGFNGENLGCPGWELVGNRLKDLGFQRGFHENLSLAQG